MVEASSAKASAENAHVTPARMKETMIAGPASPIASPMITKMPVPMMAPSPSAVRSSAPTARCSLCSESSVSATSASTGLVLNSPSRVPPPPPPLTAMRALLSLRGGDDQDRTARALHQPARDVSQHATDASARARADHDQVVLLLLGEDEDPAHDRPGAVLRGHVDP